MIFEKVKAYIFYYEMYPKENKREIAISREK